MVPLNLIVCATKTNGIGQAGKLPWRLKEDMKFFKHLTTLAPPEQKNVVIMGRKTWQSIPEKFRPLSNRINIVVSRQTDPRSLNIDPQQDSHLVNSLESACQLIQRIEPTIDCESPAGEQEGSGRRKLVNKVFVIGGAELYKTALGSNEGNRFFKPSTILMTRILSDHPPLEKSLDAFFPEFRHDKGWSKSQNSHEQNHFLVRPPGSPIHPANQKDPMFHFDQLIIEDSFMYKFELWTRVS